MSPNLLATLVCVLGTLLTACQPQQPGKPDYEVSYVSQEKLVRLAVAKMKEAGLDAEYNVAKPLYAETPSQMGEAFVGFVTGKLRPDEQGFLRQQCIVPVNSLFGTAGKPEELGKDSRRVFVHLDKKGNVTGYRTGPPPKAPLRNKE